jgi:Ca-activated chloride channel family protein
MRCITIALALLMAACQPVHRKTNAPDNTGPALVATTTAPVPADPKLVELAAALDRSAIAADRKTVLTTRLRMSAATAKSLARPPLSLVLVVDTSGSMAGTAIEDARAAAKALVASMRDDDRIAIVTFDSRAEVLVAATTLKAAGRKTIGKRIDDMQARGTTDLASGMATALAQIGSAPADSIRRVVLLSDGVPNDATNVPGYAESLRASGVALTTLGFGLEYDETLLGQLAQSTGGSFHRVGEGEALAQAFVDEAFRLERVVASNVVLALQAGPGVEIRRVLGHPAVPANSRSHSVVLGELSEGQHQDVFVEIAVTGHRDGANVELLDASVAFDERAVNAGRLERRSFLAVQATADEDVVARARDLEIERGAARARAATATLDAIALARNGQFAEASDMLEHHEKDARPRAKDDAELEAQLQEMAKLRKTFTSEAKAQAAAIRELARKPKQGPGPEPTKTPMPFPVSGEAGSGIKRSHAEAIDMLQARD